MSLWFSGLLKVCSETIKSSEHNLLKIMHHYITIITELGTSFQSLQ